MRVIVSRSVGSNCASSIGMSGTSAAFMSCSAGREWLTERRRAKRLKRDSVRGLNSKEDSEGTSEGAVAVCSWASGWGRALLLVSSSLLREGGL